MDKQYIIKKFSSNGIVISDQQGDSFLSYMNFLLEENEKYNLTAITDQQEIVSKHFLDSCLILDSIKKGTTIIDIGAGAGFPGIPLAILLPENKFVLVDSLQKRVNFLQEAVKKLNLKNCEVIWSRSENLAENSKYREKFDYCLARAVAKLNTLCEYCLPFVKIGGEMVAYKSKDVDMEIKEADNAIKILGGKLKEIKSFNLENMDRKLIFIEKSRPTDKKYPRKQNKAKTNPL